MSLDAVDVDNVIFAWLAVTSLFVRSLATVSCCIDCRTSHPTMEQQKEATQTRADPTRVAAASR